jgi:N-acetylglucosaminyldiphosphoundecaprenol N-acetyl-beta-D-mannosaminyltransferase
MSTDISNLAKPNIAGVHFDLIDYRSIFEQIHTWRNDRTYGHYITITNPHSVLLCHRDPEMSRATSGACMTLPDGVGIVLAASLLGYKNYGRVTGPTLMLRLCDWGREFGYKHYFYGGAEGVADKLRDKLSQMFPGLQTAGTYCPPFRPLSKQEDEMIVEQINRTEPDIVWVGLGAPKQEKWMSAHLDKISATAMIGVGAAFDFHSGNVKWAPASIRKLGLEWAYRLAKEPKRMWRRNLDSLIFLAKVI